MALRRPPPRRGVLGQNKDKVLISKRIPPSENATKPQTIPRVIWQTWMNDGRHNAESLWVERTRAEAMLSWIEMNPTYEYRLHDDDDMEQFALQEYGKKALQALKGIDKGAGKADLWRYMVMHRHGGVYFDTDSECKGGFELDKWVPPEASYVTGLGRRGDFHQWGLLATPGNCIFNTAIHDILNKVLVTKSHMANYTYIEAATWEESSKTWHVKFGKQPRKDSRLTGFTGPSALMQAADECLIGRKTKDTKNTLKGLIVCPADYFGGRVVFKKRGIPSTWLHRQSLTRRTFKAKGGPPVTCAPMVIDKH